MRATEREALADVFDALGNPKRLEMIEMLRVPRLVGEIEVAQERGAGNISRQMVAKHLQRLLDAGIVHRQDVVRSGRDAVEFTLDHQTLFQLSEAVRGLARVRPRVAPSLETTPRAPDERAHAKGPCLVTARALDDGDTHPLDPSSGVSSWTIGRRRDSTIALDFDPSVSGAHCVLRWTGKEHTIEDAGSRNGTYVNFHRIAKEEPIPLRHGDLVGIGRCLFVYWA